MGKRLYSLNERFFSQIDTQEKAYWLGFITADGCISDSCSKRLIVCLQTRDREHLQRLCSALESQHPVKDRIGSRGNEESWLTICSSRLYKDLTIAGITPAKSFTQLPWGGRVDLLHHYWRGVFDGDGHISLNKRYGWWMVGIVGSEAMVRAFQGFAHAACGTLAQPRCRQSHWIVEVGGVAAPQALVQALYRDATVSLPRKRELAQTLLAQPNKRRARTLASMGGGA